MTGRKGPCRRSTCLNKAWNFGHCEPHVAELRAAGKLPPPRPQRSLDQVMEEWRLLAGAAAAGTTQGMIAIRMGLKPDALRQALCRARRQGDPRAITLHKV